MLLKINLLLKNLILFLGYDPEEYQEVVDRHHRIDSERMKLKQEVKETKRIEDEEILKKKINDKSLKKISREKRREELAARLKTFFIIFFL